MNKIGCILFLWINFLFLSSCSDAVRKPAVMVDVEQYTHDGVVAYNNAEWNKAKRFFNKALRLYQGIDHLSGIMLSHINLAEVALAENDTGKGERHLRVAKTMANDDLLQGHRSRIILLLSHIALQNAQLLKAAHLLQKLLPEFDGVNLVSVPDDIQMAAIVNQTKIAFLGQQDEAKWTQRYANALKKLSQKRIEDNARLLRFQAALLLQQGADNEAELKMQKALYLYKEKLARRGIASTLFELGQYYQSKHRWHQAQDYLQRALVVYEYLGNAWKVGQITGIIDEVKSIRLN
jgi:tetratricopeptide (TPR) repeat protein